MSNKKRQIKITFENGDEFLVPVTVVAEHRADYYRKKEGEAAGQMEYQFTLTDSYEAIDWLQNNMDWRDVVSFAKRVRAEKPYSYDENWAWAEIDFE